MKNSVTVRQMDNRIKKFEQRLEAVDDRLTLHQNPFLDEIIKAGKTPRARTSDVKITSRVYEKSTDLHQYVNQYMLLQVVGEGTTGKVRKAISLDNKKPYAIKVIDKERFRR